MSQGNPNRGISVRRHARSLTGYELKFAYYYNTVRKRERVAAGALTPAALIFLSVFEPDAFDHSMDVAQSDDENPGATGEAEPVCAICGGKIGIFLERGLAWRHYTGDGTTVG
jgi:hypothetical protein